MPVRGAGCWEWGGARSKAGYGQIRSGGRGVLLYAHRVAYELARGPIPPGLVIDHLCRNRGCVNPDHLEVVTNGENLLRGDTFAAENARKTHCPYGHPYQGDNLYLTPKHGHRQCRICTRRRLS